MIGIYQVNPKANKLNKTYWLLRHRLGRGNAVSASIGVLVHEWAMLLATTARLIFPVAWDLFTVFLEKIMIQQLYGSVAIV